MILSIINRPGRKADWFTDMIEGYTLIYNIAACNGSELRYMGWLLDFGNAGDICCINSTK